MSAGAKKASTTSAVQESQDRFVAVWGQMGSAWGISRTMAEVHALLYITGEPMCTDDVMRRLQISRGNASMSLRALLEWGLVGRSHRRGDRKEYFEAERDVWTMFRAIVRERLKREVDPLLASLYEIRDMTDRAGESAEAHNKRLEDMVALVERVNRLGTQFTGSAGAGMLAAASILDSVSDAVAPVIARIRGEGGRKG